MSKVDDIAKSVEKRGIQNRLRVLGVTEKEINSLNEKQQEELLNKLLTPEWGRR